MSTINQLITDALIDLGRLSPADTIDSNDLTHGLRVINRLLGQWATEDLLIPYTTSESFSMDGSSSYTMGTGGTASSTRAIKLIDNCYVQDSAGLTYPVKLINQDQYNNIYDKDIAGLPEVIFYDPLYATGYIYPWRLGGSEYTMYIESVKTLHASLATGNTVSLSVEYEDFIVLQLRNRLAGSFGIPVTQDMRYEALQAMNNIKRLNFVNRSQEMEMPAGFGNRGFLGTIESC